MRATVLLILAAIAALITGCARLANEETQPQSVTYQLYGVVSANISVTVQTELEGAKVITLTPADLPWRYQTGYAAGIRYYMQADVTPVIRGSGTVTDDTTPYHLVDSTAAFAATAQENDFVYNLTTGATSIVDKILLNTDIAVGDDIFGAGTLGDSYRIYDRQMLGAMVLAHYENGTESILEDGRTSAIVSLRLDLP